MFVDSLTNLRDCAMPVAQTTTLIVLLVLFPKSGDCIRCYSCSQQVPNSVRCINSTVQDCSYSFPQQQSVCLKTVRLFSNGLPPWVFAQCQLRSGLTNDQVNTCLTIPAEGGTAPGDTVTTCTCSAELCNSSPSSHRHWSFGFAATIGFCFAYLLLNFWR